MGSNDRCMVLRYHMYGNRPAVIAGCSLKPRSSAQVVLSAFTTAVPLNPPSCEQDEEKEEEEVVVEQKGGKKRQREQTPESRAPLRPAAM